MMSINADLVEVMAFGANEEGYPLQGTTLLRRAISFREGAQTHNPLMTLLFLTAQTVKSVLGKLFDKFHLGDRDNFFRGDLCHDGRKRH